MNFEIKRFLMDCGEEWRDTYLEYLPEEILQMIYKIIYECCLENMDVKSSYFNEYNRRPTFNPERKSKYTLSFDMDYLFPYGYVPQYKSDCWSSVKHRLYNLPFTNSKHVSSFDGSHITYYAQNETNKSGQIQAFEQFDYLGVNFKQDRYHTKVKYDRGSIKEGQLRYLFKKDNYCICVRNINKINKKTKEIKFEIILNDTIWNNSFLRCQSLKTELLDRKQSIECMFDENYGNCMRGGMSIVLYPPNTPPPTPNFCS